MKRLLSTLTVFLCLTALTFTGCTKSSSQKENHIAVFIPGIMADSPIYAKLSEGVQQAVDIYNSKAANSSKVKLSVFEAGTNQSEWSGKITQLAATGTYSVIISSNPSLPELCAPIAEQFPNQKFILLDSNFEGNKSIFTVNYDQKVQSYLSGYIAGLMSKNHKIGLVAGQEYPVMNNIILPYYAKGAADAEKSTTVDFRVVGNWYDASKGAELTDAMCLSGVDVVLPICGGASQGVISSAKEHKIKLNWFDEDGFSKAPGTIISSCLVKQNEAAKEMTLKFLESKIEWGTSRTIGFADGYFEFVQDNPLYTENVPENVRIQMKVLTESFLTDTIKLQ